jgi:AcrR family transcriptional regulator
MSPRTIEQNELIREGKRKHIMDAALTLFSNQGFHATSISQIAQMAEISKGLMYNYFQSKEELLQSIVSEGYRKIYGAFDPNNDGILTKEEMVLFINDVFTQINANPLYWKLYFSLTMQPSALNEFLKQQSDRGALTMKMLVNYFERKGVPNPLVEAYFFSSAMEGICIGYLLDPNYPIKDIRKLMLQRFL